MDRGSAYCLPSGDGRAGRWVDHLSRDEAVAATVQLQWDVGLMQTNLDVLDQYSLKIT